MDSCIIKEIEENKSSFVYENSDKFCKKYLSTIDSKKQALKK
jgi:hypothetical protein